MRICGNAAITDTKTKNLFGDRRQATPGWNGPFSFQASQILARIAFRTFAECVGQAFTTRIRSGGMAALVHVRSRRKPPSSQFPCGLIAEM